MFTTYDKRVAKGVNFLDNIKADWREHVDVDKLDMSSGFDCIVGQVFGCYVKLSLCLDISNPFFEAIGFKVPHSDSNLENDDYSDLDLIEVEYAWLENAWRDVLTRA